jgi:hypothetical protein
MNMAGKTKKNWLKAVLTIIIVCSLGFSFVLCISYFYPKIADSLNVIECFLLFYIMMICLWFAMFIGFNGFNKTSFKLGAVISIFSAMYDVFFSPYAIDMAGNLGISNTAGYKGSIDYTFGYYLMDAGLHGPLVFWATYLIIPILLLLLFLLIWKPRMFMRGMKESL